MGVKESSTEDQATRPFTVVYAPTGYLEDRGYGRVGHLPFIFDHRPRYHRLGNQFLIDVGTGTWSITTRGREPVTPLPGKASMRTYAYLLANYLEFCHQRGIDPLQIEYLDLLQSYQGAMQAGTWSSKGEGLGARTVNSRVDVAVMFLMWASDKGLREEFHVPTVTRTLSVDRARTSGAKTQKTVESRKGKARENKRRLGFPEERAIGAWLGRLRDRCATKGLIAETIVSVRRTRLDDGH